MTKGHRHHWTDIPRSATVLIPWRQQCTSCLRLRDVKHPKGTLASAIDHLLDDILRPGVDREEDLWPLIYEYADATVRRELERDAS